MSVHVNRLLDQLEDELTRAQSTLRQSEKSYEYYKKLFEGAVEDRKNAKRYVTTLQQAIDDIKRDEEELYG